MREEWKQIEAVLDEKVRPSLRAHGGELEICLLYTSPSPRD